MNRERRRFWLTRVLLILGVAALLGGMFFDQWRIVLRNAILL